MMTCVVAIPVYQAIPSKTEQKSFEQALKILYKHQIILVTYKEFTTSYYEEIAKKHGANIRIAYFDQIFFNNLKGYNSLCLSLAFYEKFSLFDYMLIYQLDAYIFRDELFFWCEKGYDYIGAPWFENNSCYEDGAKLWAVGNGGFSLRRVSTFVNLFKTNKRVYSFKYLYKKSKIKSYGVSWLLRSCLFGYENNFQHLLQTWDDAEDLFYCLKLVDTTLKLKVPPLKEAMAFAFEQSPQYLFEMNNKKMPFGCHGWQKYQYETFWNQHIIVE